MCFVAQVPVLLFLVLDKQEQHVGLKEEGRSLKKSVMAFAAAAQVLR